jgi:chain length determinant protein EpsF
MDFTQFLLALRARRKAFLMVFVATVVAAIAVALILPKKYVSTATVVVDLRDEQALTPTRSALGIGRERAAYVATHIDLIKSGRVASGVARELKMAQWPGVREAFEADTGGVGSIEDWMAAVLLQNLEVEASAGNLISIQYSSENPRAAAQIANGFVSAYLATALHLRTEPTREASEWFEEQLNGLRSRVQQAQNKLTSYQKAKGIVAVDERVDIDTARLSELSTQVLAARNATYDTESRYRQASELLQSGASPEAIPDVLSSSYISGMRAELIRAQARLAEAGTVLGPNHPAYQRIAAEVQGMRDKLGEEMKKLVAGLGNAVQQAKKREQELQAAAEAQQGRIMRTKDERVQLAAMTREVDNAQRSYDTVLARYMTTRIESRARQADVALLTPALEPIKPAHPKVGLISMLSVVLGALLAAGTVYLLEVIDRRVRSRADLEARLAVPSLGRLSRWQPTGGRLLPAPSGAARALPHPW